MHRDQIKFLAIITMTCNHIANIFLTPGTLLFEVMIGDREHDVIGAHENGLDCLGILYGFGSRKEFEEAGADYIRENVEDILQFV